MAKQLTLYTAKVCPYAHRVEIALQEAGVPFIRFEINLQNKPEWYASKANPASKVPAITYGGPAVDPSDPSPESEKIAESLVLLEFVADISGKLLPADPVGRARVRFFIDAVSNQFLPAMWGTVLRGEPIENVFNALDKLQALLPAEGFAIGNEFTIADASVAPFLARLEVILKMGFGSFKDGTGKNVYETLQSDPKFARYRKYYSDLTARESFKKTWDEEEVCPYAQRVEIALQEAGIDFTRFEIDLQNKPHWYATLVNPASKVPAVAYGGPCVDPSQPSPESEKIVESLVLLEFIADISCKLLPADPVLRARVRLFINAVSGSFDPALWASVLRGEPVANILSAVEKIQALLPSDGFAVGPEFTIADAALAPFLARLEIILKNDFGAFEEGTGKEAYELLESNPKYARYRQYSCDIKARDSFEKTFPEEAVVTRLAERHAERKAQVAKPKCPFL
ncbi:putative glutathione [Lyophyllum shimeji]|uniref:Glutathione n=1 Tax=Lyophyllum shimeji TaxID=47721 RepID=A0A9P3PQ71_LYOSH|nr:putative glutathione [Lyophyllum shimeji]